MNALVNIFQVSYPSRGVAFFEQQDGKQIKGIQESR